MTPERARLAVLANWLAVTGSLLIVSTVWLHASGFLSSLLTGALVAVALGLSLAIGTQFRRVRDERIAARLDEIDPLGGLRGAEGRGGSSRDGTTGGAGGPGNEPGPGDRSGDEGAQ